MTLAMLLFTQQEWRRRSVSAVGVLLGLLSGVHLFYDADMLLMDAFEILVPVCLSLSLVLFGMWLNRSDYTPGQVVHIAEWTVGGALLLALLGGWALFLMLQEGLPTDEMVPFLMTDITLGAGAGALVGLYNVRRQVRFQEAEQSYDALEAAHDGIAVLNGDAEYTYVNQAHVDIYGYSDAAAFLGESWRMCYDEDQVSEIEEQILPVLETEGWWRGELTGQRRDGTTFPQEVTLSVREDGSLVCIVREITDRKQQEQQLADLHTATRELIGATTQQQVCRIAAETAESILNQPITGVWLYDADQDVLEPCGATQYARELFDGVPTFERGRGLLWRAWEDGETKVYDDIQTEAEAYNPDTPVRSEIHVPVSDAGILSIASEEVNAFDEHDITAAQILAANTEAALARAAREHSLRDQYAFIESVLDSLSDVFYVLDQDGTFQRWNDPLTEVSGYSDSELEGMPALTLIPEEDHPMISEAMLQVYQHGATETRESGLVTKSGQRIPYQLNGAPLYDSDDNIVGLVGTGRDITTRQLREERLTVISRVLRHNLRNDMNSIYGHTEHVLRQVDDPDLRQSLERVVETAEDLIHLGANAHRIETALERRPEATRLNLATVVQTAVDAVEADLEPVDLRIDVSPDLWVSAIESLRVALTEAIENAIIHQPSDDPIIRLSATRATDANSQGEWVTITVADDGELIPQAEQAVLTDGETPLEHGSGLGLWLINWVVVASGGTLSFHTSDWGGNAVQLQLKSAESPPGDTDGETPPDPES